MTEPKMSQNISNICVFWCAVYAQGLYRSDCIDERDYSDAKCDGAYILATKIRSQKQRKTNTSKETRDGSNRQGAIILNHIYINYVIPYEARYTLNNNIKITKILSQRPNEQFQNHFDSLIFYFRCITIYSAHYSAVTVLRRRRVLDGNERGKTCTNSYSALLTDCPSSVNT